MAKERNFNPLACFALSPAKINFEIQNPGEEVVLLLRRHLVTNVGWVILGSILFYLPRILPWESWIPGVPGKYKLILFLTWYALVIGYILVNFLTWYYHVFLVTTDRILDMDLVGFLYRHVVECPLRKIQDVSHKQGGLVQLVFNYGHVFIQTAGARQEIEFEDVPQPGRVHDIITDLVSEIS